jgi:hypothetical protein
MNKLNKFRTDDGFNVVINELAESLVFSKLHQYLYFSLQQFNADSEEELRGKIITMRNDFSFNQYKLDPIFNEIKYKASIAEFKKISTVTIPFEKLVSCI